jgi:septum formation protein
MFRNLEPLVLASRSPRRNNLLLSAGVAFTVHPSGVDEPVPPDGGPGADSPAQTAEECARLKARSVSALYPGAWVLGADTIVVVEGRIFGKPADEAEAIRMLETLSGRTHEVITGICLVGPAGEGAKTGSDGGGGRQAGGLTAAVVTRVRFKPLSRAEIEAYVRSGEPMDKAGAYGIQDGGAFLVRSVEGSYTNVVGLPLCEVIEWLSDARVIEPA